MSVLKIEEMASKMGNGKQLDKFRTLLDGFSTLDEKKKFLWLEIYNNAINEILMSQKLFQECYDSINRHDSVEQIEAGPILAKYLERSNKANEQLIKLAAMLEDAEQKDQESSFDDIRSASDAILKQGF